MNLTGDLQLHRPLGEPSPLSQ